LSAIIIQLWAFNIHLRLEGILRFACCFDFCKPHTRDF
jgi:hypothetical protein